MVFLPSFNGLQQQDTVVENDMESKKEVSTKQSFGWE